MFSGIGQPAPLSGAEIRARWDQLRASMVKSPPFFTGKEICEYNAILGPVYTGNGLRPFRAIWFDELAGFIDLRVPECLRHLCAMPSDFAGIVAERVDPPAPKVDRPSSVKPAISGLGVSAPVTHKLGGFGAVEGD